MERERMLHQNALMTQKLQYETELARVQADARIEKERHEQELRRLNDSTR
jgi:hypothetical protein